MVAMQQYPLQECVPQSTLKTINDIDDKPQSLLLLYYDALPL